MPEAIARKGAAAGENNVAAPVANAKCTVYCDCEIEGAPRAAQGALLVVAFSPNLDAARGHESARDGATIAVGRRICNVLRRNIEPLSCGLHRTGDPCNAIHAPIVRRPHGRGIAEAWSKRARRWYAESNASREPPAVGAVTSPCAGGRPWRCARTPAGGVDVAAHGRRSVLLGM